MVAGVSGARAANRSSLKVPGRRRHRRGPHEALGKSHGKNVVDHVQARGGEPLAQIDVPGPGATGIGRNFLVQEVFEGPCEEVPVVDLLKTFQEERVDVAVGVGLDVIEVVQK